MKYKIWFSVIAVVAIMLAVSGCYKFGEGNDNISVSDIFEESGDTGEDNAIEDGGELEAEEESALAKILKERAEDEVAETEEAEVEEEEVEEEVEIEIEGEVTTEEEDDSEDKSTIPTKTVKEGELVSFASLKATDADGDSITYTYSEPLDDSGEWQTEEGDAGKYIVTITASDGKSEVSQKIMIVVKALNNEPVVNVEDITVQEGDTVNIEPEVIDADNDPITIEYSGWMESDTYETTSDDAGVYTVTITVSDGKTTVSKDVIVTVEDRNRAPVLSEIKDIKIRAPISLQ